ncbi:hypothetical protein [Sphingopyxis sp.]|uniref:hypothetical protein n=1 Tax=Sphingopyxis sp. TaxID=1908224 RepID=UPI002EDB6707
MIRNLFCAAALAAALPSFAAAQLTSQSIEEKNLISGKAKIEPDSGYIYVSGPFRQNALLLRLPDETTVAAYEKDWAEALAKVQKKYPAKLKSWEQRAAIARQTKAKNATIPEKPIEPTAENFAIGAIELRDPVSFGPQYVFAKSESPESYSYLTKVKPGRYAYYGPIFVAGGGAMAGFCYCMGTVAFEVKPGVITDTGNFFLVGPGLDPDFPPPSTPLAGSEAGLYRPQNLGSQHGPLRFGVPESLKAFPYAEADFRAYGKLDNFYGLSVGRMPPVPGVLAYDRDKIVDLKAGAAAAGSGGE